MRRLRDEFTSMLDAEHFDHVMRCTDDAIAVLAELHDSVTAAGARFVVALIPDQVQVAPVEAGASLDMADALESEISSRLAAASVPSVDLLPALRAAAASGTLLYRRGDTHLSLEGNQIVAETLLDSILDDAAASTCFRPSEAAPPGRSAAAAALR
jgi:hypothetical protein